MAYCVSEHVLACASREVGYLDAIRLTIYGKAHAMELLALQHNYLPLILCGAFYGVLCVFSIVTGLIYMSGKRELNPLELSDSFMERLSDQEKLRRFTVRMGFATFVVGIVQGLTSFAMLRVGSVALYALAFGFNLFSIGSVSVKLRGKVNAFPLLKAVAYLTILVVMLLGSTRALFF